MAGALYQFFIDDHRRLEDLLNRAVADLDQIDTPSYEAFRGGLLKHIGMEEKILLPAAQQARGGEPLPTVEKLRLDHGALATLLVPHPSSQIIAAIRAILADHNLIEESPGGLYETCERLAEEAIEDLLAKVQSAPEVSAMPHKSDPNVFDVLRRVVARAGYDFDDYAKSAQR